MALWTTYSMHIPWTPQFLAFVKDYLANPDPVAWLAAADYLDELGGDRYGSYSRASAIWRRRGEWFPELRHELHVAIAAPGLVDPRFVALGRWKAQFDGMGGLNRVRWRLADSVTNSWKKEHRILSTARTRNYHTMRLIEMIDDLLALDGDSEP